MTPVRLLKKIFSLTLSALAVLIVSGFLSLQPIAESPVYAQQVSPDYAIVEGTNGETCGGYTWADIICRVNEFLFIVQSRP